MTRPGTERRRRTWVWRANLGWRALPSWSWPGFEGLPVTVDVISDADEVELLVNGVSVGRQQAGSAHKLPHHIRDDLRSGRDRGDRLSRRDPGGLRCTAIRHRTGRNRCERCTVPRSVPTTPISLISISPSWTGTADCTTETSVPSRSRSKDSVSYWVLAARTRVRKRRSAVPATTRSMVGLSQSCGRQRPGTITVIVTASGFAPQRVTIDAQ